MKPAEHRRNGRSRTVGRELPPSLLCAKLGEDFELFSDRMEDALECENLIHDLGSIRDDEAAADDFR
jgi:hypothetical protein